MSGAKESPEKTSAVTIERAEKTALAEVAAVFHAVWHETQAPLQPTPVASGRDRAFFEHILTKSRSRPLVARDGRGQLLGFVHWEKALIQSLYLAPDARGRGVGSALLAAAEDQIRVSGAAKCALMCLVGNDRARAFYERHGYRVTLNRNVRVAVPRGAVIVKAWRMQKNVPAGKKG